MSNSFGVVTNFLEKHSPELVEHVYNISLLHDPEQQIKQLEKLIKNKQEDVLPNVVDVLNNLIEVCRRKK